MQRPTYFKRTSTPLRPLRSKAKLLILALKQITARRLVEVLGEVRGYGESKQRKLARMDRIIAMNTHACMVAAWQRLRARALADKAKDRKLRSVGVLVRRAETGLLKEVLARVHKYGFMRYGQAMDRICQSKAVFLLHCLRRLGQKNKRLFWQNLKSLPKKSSLHKGVKTISTVIKGAQKRTILSAWIRIVSKMKSTPKPSPNPELVSKVQDLTLQLQDMMVQIDNKTCNISRLQQQIAQLKQNSYAHFNNNSFGINNSFNNRSGSNLNRSRSRELNFDKQSNDGSVGSILGLSMLSYRSRGSNAGLKLDDCACNVCGYRERYDKYKATSDTLKKQLDLIKSELEFTKDMNEHLENQLRNSISNDEKDRKLEKLRAEIRQSLKEREALKEKVLKYEKYVAKLKSEFKTKIEEIYRRVRKDA